MRALVVAGPFAGRQRLVEHLRSKGHQLEHAETGEDGLDLARRYEFDAIIVSLTLSDVRGLDLIRRVRDMGRGTPVLALSPTPHAAPRIAALEAGVDDVMVLPLDEVELEMRMHGLVRRSLGHSRNLLSAGPVSMDLQTREVAVNGRPLYLTAKESAVLELLMLRCDRPVTKEAFLSQLYASADEEPEPKIIDVFVCKLRRQLAAAGAPDVIETVWGQGYLVRSKGQRHRSVADPLGGENVGRPVLEMV